MTEPRSLFPDGPQCGASRLYAGAEHRCALPEGHDGDHEKSGISEPHGTPVTIAWKDPRSPLQRWGGR